jgi:AcrR family transcriptional regulator
MDTMRDKIIKVIEGMWAANEKMSIHSVAHKCDVSHSLIYNRYPDLKERIKELKAKQQVKIQAANEQKIIEKLIAQNKALKTNLKAAKSDEDDKSFKALLAHITEVYRMYDELRVDRDSLAERLREMVQRRTKPDGQ